MQELNWRHALAKLINQVEIRFADDREKLILEAMAEDETCVSVGALAKDLEELMPRPVSSSGNGVKGK